MTDDTVLGGILRRILERVGRYDRRESDDYPGYVSFGAESEVRGWLTLDLSDIDITSDELAAIQRVYGGNER